MLKAFNWIVQQFQIGPNVAGTGPAFSAYANAAVTFVNNVSTKVPLQVEEFDTNNNFDSTTNYRFQPTVAGYYQISGGTAFNPDSSAFRFVWLAKNGSVYKYYDVSLGGSPNFKQSYGSCLVYLNGTTDFVELYAVQNSGSSLTNYAGIDGTYLQGFLARAA